MKFLFITQDIGIQDNANSNIVMAVCTELANDHEVYFFSVSQYIRQRHFYHNGFPVYSFGLKEGMIEYSALNNRFTGILKLLLIIAKPMLWGSTFRRTLMKLFSEKYLCFESTIASNMIRRLHKKLNFDKIVAVCEPEISIHIVARLKHDDISIYQLDPYHSNAIKLSKLKDWRLGIELRAYKNARRIFLPRLINNEYGNTVLSRYESKWKVIEFPLIRKHLASSGGNTINFDNRKINWLFCGVLSLEYRNPKFALDLLKEVGNDYKFYLIGSNCKDIIERELGITSNNVVAYDSVPNDEIYDIMSRADILINLGNSMKNQMPSKLIDYMSTGKPIINIIKNHECITTQYTSRYPMAIDILEGETICQSDIAKVDVFCRKYKGKVEPFAEIERKFFQLTPKYAAGILSGNIQ